MTEPYIARQDPSSADHAGLSVDTSRPPRAVPNLPHCGRLHVELQLLGTLTLGWLFACAHAWVWMRASVGVDVPLEPLLLGRLAVPQFIALAVVAMRTLVDLPAARWDRRGSFVGRRWPWAFALCGWLLLPIAIVMVLRDRSARTQRWSDEAVQAAHVRLLQLPAATGIRVLGWASVAFAVDVLLLAAERAVPRPAMIALALVCIGAVGPIAVISLGAVRAVLRPEVLTVPIAAAPRRGFDVQMRLQLQLLIAGLGAIGALGCAGVLWTAAEHGHRAGRSAAASAQRVA
ncbi:MAG: hypothetical protein IAG13_08465, partial [Deltaproteobacteria bacterium]|nr:hypothetical protein [Nannocystaceae bacterium]